MRTIIDSLAQDRPVCQGRSSGGYAALRMGLDLRADAVLAFGAQTNMVLNMAPRGSYPGRAEVSGRTWTWRNVRGALRTCEAPMRRCPSRRGRVWAIRAAMRATSSRPALRGLPGVTLEPAADPTDHEAFYYALRAGYYVAQPDELVREPAEETR